MFALRGVGLERNGRRILDDVTLALPAAAITGIIGPSGAGKTSLLRLLNRLDEPCAGTIEFSGRRLTDYGVRELRRKVALVFQTPALFPGSVADNLRVAAELGGTGGAAALELATVLRAVGLDASDAKREVAVLSGGEQQRVGIARALMTEPEVLLLDEPTSALDPELAQRLLASIGQLARERSLSVVLVTHRLGEARQFTSRCIMLEAGRVVEACSTAQMFGGAASERARAYVAGGQ